ncbi:MAG TPA: hypothetical protein VK250_07090 [Nitrososphaeraceae archaeon]|nr:hypothetical protein [Nitrososphaeraceae archaeon]
MPSERFQIGTYEIPMIRFLNLIPDLREIYENNIGNRDFTMQDVARYLKYASPTSSGLPRKIYSMEIYGLISSISRGKYKIEELGKDILFPEKVKESSIQKQAIFNVQLWKKLYDRIQKNIPDSLFSQLRNITNAEPLEIEKKEKQIREWYLEDISIIPDEILEQNKQKSYNTDEYNNKQIMQNQQFTIDSSIHYPDERLENEFGVLSAKGIGSIKITDEDTLELAKSVLEILLKKIKSMNLLNTVKQTEPTIKDAEVILNNDKSYENKKSSPEG